MNIDNVHSFNVYYKRERGYLYFCVADMNLQDRIVWNFLDDLSSAYQKSDMKKPSNLIKEKLFYFNNPYNDKINSVQNKVDLLKEKMIQNVQDLIGRGEKLVELEGVTDEIAEGAKEFEQHTNQVKWNMRKRTAVIVFVLLMLLLLIIAILIMSGCGFPTFYKCKSN